MITIKEASREFTKVETYLMTLAPSIKVLKNVEDYTSIEVDGFLIFDDLKEDTGEVSEILSIITPEKEVFCCQSNTFKRALKDVDKNMDGDKYSIVKLSGKTKAGRDFITCTLDLSAL